MGLRILREATRKKPRLVLDVSQVREMLATATMKPREPGNGERKWTKRGPRLIC